MSYPNQPATDRGTAHVLTGLAAAGLVVALLLAGCPTGSDSGTPSDACTSLLTKYDQLVADMGTALEACGAQAPCPTFCAKLAEAATTLQQLDDAGCFSGSSALEDSGAQLHAQFTQLQTNSAAVCP